MALVKLFFFYIAPHSVQAVLIRARHFLAFRSGIQSAHPGVTALEAVPDSSA